MEYVLQLIDSYKGGLKFGLYHFDGLPEGPEVGGVVSIIF